MPSPLKPDPLSEAADACAAPDGNCKGRTHFVLHQTVDGNLTAKEVKKRFGGKKGKSHQFILKNGTVVPLWPLDTDGVFATKSETKKKPVNGTKPAFALLGKMVHTEIDYEDGGQPTADQYAALRDLYIEACKHFGHILTIVPHIEVDRGFSDGHSDPQNFQYNDFYKLLGGAGINMARVPHFDHQRYWGQPNFKTPFASDIFSWPPKLTGNPHAGAAPKPKKVAKEKVAKKAAPKKAAKKKTG